MNEYTVCFLFDRWDCSRVLMCLKDRTKYAGKFNGIGGKIEPGETSVEGAAREIEEETGARVLRSPVHVCAKRTNDCTGKSDAEDDCVLHFMAAMISGDSVEQQEGETELLAWIPTRTVFTHSEWFAGEGDLQEALRSAVEYYVGKEAANRLCGEQACG